MKANVYSLDGKIAKSIELPAGFDTPVRGDLIKRAVLSDESKLYQPKGSYRWAGLETSARYRGRKEDFGAVKNKGIPHLPHEVLPKGQLGKVKRVPHAMHGRRAHPPKPQKKLIEKMNRKEYARALASALAASTNAVQVQARYGTPVPGIPLIVENAWENVHKTKQMHAALEALQLNAFVARAQKNGSKSLLFVVSDHGKLKGARNLAGVDVVAVSQLEVRHLAPGTHAGRIALFSEDALQRLQERLENKKPEKRKAENGKEQPTHKAGRTPKPASKVN